jgi:DNA-directed RNA polymerase specialized sigma24 family protein
MSADTSEQTTTSIPRDDSLSMMLSLLAPVERSVVHLVYTARYTQQQAADVLALTPATVGSALMSAYRRIAGALESESAPPTSSKMSFS